MHVQWSSDDSPQPYSDDLLNQMNCEAMEVSDDEEYNDDDMTHQEDTRLEENVQGFNRENVTPPPPTLLPLLH